MEQFKKLGLCQEILDVLSELKFEKPSEIQEKAIPLALAGKDIIGGSATGSGKTLAFASPIIQKLEQTNHVQALILTPTRELAEQVADSIRQFAKNKRLNVLAIYGGTDIQRQIRKIKNADVIVATPGRIIDHLKRMTLTLKHVKFLVLDEVDRMFDMGFRNDVEKIIFQCPKNRQTMLFSATISADIDYLAKEHTRDAVEVAVNSYVDHSKLKQIYYDVANNMKFSLLVHLLKSESSNLAMIFCGTRRNVDFVAENLNGNRVNAVAIHGGLTQNRRTKIMNDFQKGGIQVLVCTDVAARGLDIKGVSHVYNYDFPTVADDYVHRIGRTARAGKEGVAITLLSSRDYENFGAIQRNDSLKIETLDLPLFKRIYINISSGKSRNQNRDSRDQGRGRSSSGNSSGYQSRGRSQGGEDSRYQSRGSSQGGRSFNSNRSSNQGENRGRNSRRQNGNASQGGRRSFNSDSSRPQRGRSFSRPRR